MQNVYFGKLKEVILIPLTVELYFVIQHVIFSQKLLPFCAVFVITFANVQTIQSSRIRIVGPVSQLFSVHNSVGGKRTHTLIEKSRERSSRCCGWPLSHAGQDLLEDRSNRLTLLRYPCQKLKLAKLSKFVDMQHDDQVYQRFIRIEVASRFSLVSKALPYSKIFIYEDSR